MFLREGGARKEKRLEYFNRDPNSVLLVDCNPLSESLNPRNTVLVSSMGEAGGAGGDKTCYAIKALISRIKEEVQARGSVNVPRALERIRVDATAEGFSTDPTGLYAFLQKRAEEEARLEHEKKEQGLGGLLRRSVADSSSFRSKLSVLDTAARRPFRDPAVEPGLGNSLLAAKVRDTNARLFGRQGAP
jgi:hypothetical protein